jgi:Na+/phosphate symporter
MAHPAPSAFLRKALLVDAAGCGVFAIGALIVLAGPEDWRTQLGVYPPLLVGAGLLALFGVPLFPQMARRKRISPTSVGLVIASNASWAVACCGAVAFGWIHATPTGAMIVIAQALATGLIALLEWIGLKSTLAGKS